MRSCLFNLKLPHLQRQGWDCFFPLSLSLAKRIVPELPLGCTARPLQVPLTSIGCNGQFSQGGTR